MIFGILLVISVMFDDFCDVRICCLLLDVSRYFSFFGRCLVIFGNFERLLVLVSCLELTSDLSGFSISPSVHLFALGQGNCVLSTTNYFLNPCFGWLVKHLFSDPCRHLYLASGLPTDHILSQIETKLSEYDAEVILQK